MDNETNIGSRIRKLRKERKLSQSDIAAKLFISQPAYCLIENTQHGIGAEHIMRLSKLFNVTSDFLLTGDKNIIKMTRKNGFIPFIKTNAQAGFGKNIGKNNYLDEYEWFRIPGFNPTNEHFLVEVEGDSMAPTIMPHDVLICQIQPKMDNVLDGSLAVLVTKEKFLVKRLHVHSDPQYFWLENDNSGATLTEKEQIKKSHILQLMMVRGKISSIIPYHVVVSKGRIKSMEDDLKMVKKELYEIKQSKPPHR